ncbi:hypothetical protein Btru_017499 [Bulinus truncatus]|nr:hypothetical protein Btru_017499 [Bulinus truncatus]
MENLIIFVGLTCLGFIIHSTKGLLCYQCADVSGNKTSSLQCQHDIAGLYHTAQNPTDNNTEYYQDCSDTNIKFDRCMIETVVDFVTGEQRLFHRGCHDGKTFEAYEHPRFQNLEPNIKTTCATLPGFLVCYQFCDVDFCNGPCDYAALQENGTCGASKAPRMFTMASLNSSPPTPSKT